MKTFFNLRALQGYAAISLLLAYGMVISGCASNEPQWYSISGKTMGTQYNIQYFGKGDLQKDIDVLLEEINQSVSTYIPSSTISQFNKTGELSIPLAENGEPREKLHVHFVANIEEAYDIFRRSDGFFDPTVGPLVEAWGFGPGGHRKETLDSSAVDSILALVGMEKISFEATTDSIHVKATVPGMHLDFSALAKGYGVDLVVNLLKTTGNVSDALVEIGGEVRSIGNSPRGDDWILGINLPEEHAAISDISARIILKDRAMATSGNYRNFYLLDGRKVWHTINPKTGYPEENTLLSATIVHSKCMTADALATASMAVGVDEAISLVRTMSRAEGFFIYRDKAGKVTTFVTDGLTKDLIGE